MTTPIPQPAEKSRISKLSFTNNQYWIIGALFLATVFTRLPFISHYLYHWDSVNFAYAVGEFNVFKQQPHPPGYILYVGIIRIVDLIFRDPQYSMVAVSILASSLTAVFLYLLGKSMFNGWVGLCSALFIASSPLFWFYGEIALPHTVDAAIVTLTALLLYQVYKGDNRYVYPSVVTLSIAGGIRQQTLIFLLPLLLLSFLHIGSKRFILAGIVGVILCLAWFIPLVSLSGGYSQYMDVFTRFSNKFQTTTSIFMGAGLAGITYNFRKLTLYTLYGWSIALLPLCLLLPLKSTYQRIISDWKNAIFLALWIIPSLAFYGFIHMGQQGLIFVYLPALMLFSGLAVSALERFSKRWVALVTAMIVLINCAIFIILPEYPFGKDSQRFLTVETLRNSDAFFRERISAITNGLDKKSTVIIAQNWRHAEYYLPDYRILHFNTEDLTENPASPVEYTPEDLGLQPPDGEAEVILFDDELDSFNQSEEVTALMKTPDGEFLKYIKFSAEIPLYIKQDGFGVGRK